MIVLQPFERALKHMQRGGYAMACPGGRENKLFFWDSFGGELRCFRPFREYFNNENYDVVETNTKALNDVGWALLLGNPWWDDCDTVVDKLQRLEPRERRDAEKVLDDWIATRRNWRFSFRKLGDFGAQEAVVDGPTVLGSLIFNVGNVVLNQVEANLCRIEQFIEENKLGTLVHSQMWSVPAKREAVFKVGEALIEEKE